MFGTIEAPHLTLCDETLITGQQQWFYVEVYGKTTQIIHVQGVTSFKLCLGREHIKILATPRKFENNPPAEITPPGSSIKAVVNSTHLTIEQLGIRESLRSLMIPFLYALQHPEALIVHRVDERNLILLSQYWLYCVIGHTQTISCPTLLLTRLREEGIPYRSTMNGTAYTVTRQNRQITFSREQRHSTTGWSFVLPLHLYEGLQSFISMEQG